MSKRVAITRAESWGEVSAANGGGVHNHGPYTVEVECLVNAKSHAHALKIVESRLEDDRENK